VSAPLILPAPSYRDLLHTAYALGRVDGLLAADFEAQESVGPSTACCRGRDPADFARYLWPLSDGKPPTGLEVNAPHWYARGFEEALSDARPASGDHRPSVRSRGTCGAHELVIGSSWH
jgi:hypothetical protein